MAVRQRSVVTREGWYYLFILSFVILGSLLRNIQLLVGLSAVLATAMILNWRWTRAMMQRLVVRRPAAETLWAGRFAAFPCEIANPRFRLSALALMVHCQFQKSDEFRSGTPQAAWGASVLKWLGSRRVQTCTFIDAVHPGEVTTAKQSVKFRERGRYLVGPVTVSTHFPLGLVKREWCDEEQVPVFVGPGTGSLSQSWVEQMLGLGWTEAQRGQTARSGEDFFSLRPYSAGDSIRWIHWRASARHRSLLVKQFQRSQSKAFSLVVDLGAYLPAGEASAAEVTEKILRILATISEVVWVRGLANVSLTLVADEEHEIQFPANEAEWCRWHRCLSLAQPHHDPGRLSETLKRSVGANGGRLASAAPLVVIAPVAIEQYVMVLRELANPDPAGDGGSASPGSGGSDRLNDFWAVQQSVRSWFAPGDPWLASWYLDADDQEDPEEEPPGLAPRPARSPETRAGAPTSGPTGGGALPPSGVPGESTRMAEVGAKVRQ